LFLCFLVFCCLSCTHHLHNKCPDTTSSPFTPPNRTHPSLHQTECTMPAKQKRRRATPQQPPSPKTTPRKAAKKPPSPKTTPSKAAKKPKAVQMEEVASDGEQGEGGPKVQTKVQKQEAQGQVKVSKDAMEDVEDSPRESSGEECDTMALPIEKYPSSPVPSSAPPFQYQHTHTKRLTSTNS